VVAIERQFELGLSGLSHPFIGIIDLVAELEGKRTLVEFKTAASDFEEYEISLSDQVTAYQLAAPEIEQIAVCVFLKIRRPRIVWHMTRRQPERVMEYLEKAEAVAGQIEQQIFYKRAGKWCRQCDYLPVCVGDQKTAANSLVKIL
jgi:hypothetical protein